jgi:hypothetical protein
MLRTANAKMRGIDKPWQHSLAGGIDDRKSGCIHTWQNISRTPDSPDAAVHGDERPVFDHAQIGHLAAALGREPTAGYQLRGVLDDEVPVKHIVI